MATEHGTCNSVADARAIFSISNNDLSVRWKQDRSRSIRGGVPAVPKGVIQNVTCNSSQAVVQLGARLLAGLAGTEDGGHRVPGPPGTGRLGARGHRQAPRGGTGWQQSPNRWTRWPRNSPTTPTTSGRWSATWPPGAGRASASPTSWTRCWPSAAAGPRGRPAAPGALPDVHAERLHQPAAGGSAGRGHLAGVHRRTGGRGLLQQALRPDPVPGLHPRLRHQLRGALPRIRGHPRNPDLHLGRHLPGPRGRPLPPRAASRRGDHQPASCPRTPPKCSRTRS